jgi:uncharacterized protein involved in copper resistance
MMMKRVNALLVAGALAICLGTAWADDKPKDTQKPAQTKTTKQDKTTCPAAKDSCCKKHKDGKCPMAQEK